MRESRLGHGVVPSSSCYEDGRQAEPPVTVVLASSSQGQTDGKWRQEFSDLCSVIPQEMRLRHTGRISAPVGSSLSPKFSLKSKQICPGRLWRLICRRISDLEWSRSAPGGERRQCAFLAVRGRRICIEFCNSITNPYQGESINPAASQAVARIDKTKNTSDIGATFSTCT